MHLLFHSFLKKMVTIALVYGVSGICKLFYVGWDHTVKIWDLGKDLVEHLGYGLESFHHFLVVNAALVAIFGLDEARHNFKDSPKIFPLGLSDELDRKKGKN